MKKTTTLSSNSFGGFLSPTYNDNKGWSSERIPPPPSSSTTSTAGINPRRHIGSSASALTTPFYSGRAIPSKWEDAERWLCSPPVTTTCPQGVCKNASMSLEQRHHKSKSGPIVPPPLKVASSPFSAGVLKAERVYRGSVGGGYGHGHGYSQSWVDLMSEETFSLSSKTDTEEKTEDTKEGEMMVSRRDIATEMSSEETSPKHKSSPPSVSETLPCRGSDVREVKMDKGAKIVKRPKRRALSSSSSSSVVVGSSSWDISEPAMTLSKLQREEAKIIAWENLQKAKAEAAIRKLEVKLEKKKSASMDKILNKLQTAKLKAQEMRRSSVSIEHRQEHQEEGEGEGNHQITRNSVKITHLVRRHTFMSPFMTCFAPRVDCRKSSSAL